MPDARGQFKGQGWSRKKELTWERIFAPVPGRETGDNHAWTLTRAERQGFMNMVAQMKP